MPPVRSTIPTKEWEVPVPLQDMPGETRSRKRSAYETKGNHWSDWFAENVPVGGATVVPLVSGLTPRQIRYALSQKGLKHRLQRSPEGYVICRLS